jgi:purine-cytosine permease-like protein
MGARLPLEGLARLISAMTLMKFPMLRKSTAFSAGLAFAASFSISVSETCSWREAASDYSSRIK